MSKSRKVIDYAEATLEVHAVYDRWLDHCDHYEREAEMLAEDQSRLRSLSAELEDEEFNVSQGILGSSLAEIQRKTKDAITVAPTCKALRSAIRLARDTVDAREATVHAADRRLSGYVARMHQLGGLMNFYSTQIPTPQVTNDSEG